MYYLGPEKNKTKQWQTTGKKTTQENSEVGKRIIPAPSPYSPLPHVPHCEDTLQMKRSTIKNYAGISWTASP